MEDFQIFLPPQQKYSTSDSGDAPKSGASLDYLNVYIKQEFPSVNDSRKKSSVYSVPKEYDGNVLEQQASKSESIVFNFLSHLKIPGLWCLFFHGRSYGGVSFRNDRSGKLIIREHDFVVFTRYHGKRKMILIEVKSTCDVPSDSTDQKMRISQAKIIKSNKRSAQHQLRDHLEMLLNEFAGDENITQQIQSFIVWPFLTGKTKDPRKNEISRWQGDEKLHVFKDTFESQQIFNSWFQASALESQEELCDDKWITLLQRFVMLSCGVFVDEISKGMLALLTQEQLQLLHKAPPPCGKPLVIHGAAGTGKTLLILRKLELLHQQGLLNEDNRALYICYWPGIREEFTRKLKTLGLSDFVDTARYFISNDWFLEYNYNSYKHIFMDESEAICLAFTEQIIKRTLSVIETKYQTKKDGNQKGYLWFLVDINQAALFLPKHSPNFLKTPDVKLTKIVRSTTTVCNMLKQLYTNPFPLIPLTVKQKTYSRIDDISVGHRIKGPPIMWVGTDKCRPVDKTVQVIIDLCTTKGIKPYDICVLPFFIVEDFLAANINQEIKKHFADGFMPQGISNAESFVMYRKPNEFLIAWVLRTKGLEFKVVIIVINADDDYDANDSEDRRKLYIMASRCTCLLIFVASSKVKALIDPDGNMVPYVISQTLFKTRME